MIRRQFDRAFSFWGYTMLALFCLCIGIAIGRTTGTWHFRPSPAAPVPAQEPLQLPEPLPATRPAPERTASDNAGKDRGQAGRLFDAIRKVESNGNDLAVGDGGRSCGPYQISRAYWQEAVSWGGWKSDSESGMLDGWDYDRLVWSRPHCEQVMTWWWELHGAQTDEEKARKHNGGPRGMSKPATIRYYRRVQAELTKERS